MFNKQRTEANDGEARSACKPVGSHAAECMRSLHPWHLSLVVTSSLDKLLVMFLVAMIKHLTQATRRRASLDWESRGTVSNGKEVMAVGADSGSRCVPSQEADRWMPLLRPLSPFIDSRTPAPGKVTTTIKVEHHTPVTPFWKHTQNIPEGCSMVILNPEELTVKMTMTSSERMAREGAERYLQKMPTHSLNSLYPFYWGHLWWRFRWYRNILPFFPHF